MGISCTGYNEKVYKNSLRIELHKAGLTVKQQKKILVCYDGEHVGESCTDIVVNNCAIVKLKAARQLIADQEVLSQTRKCSSLTILRQLTLKLGCC